MDKKNLPLILAISSPILLIIIAALVIYLPNYFVKPKYDFIYATQNSYGYNPKYEVVNGKIQQNNTYSRNQIYPPIQNPAAKLYYYNVSTDKSTEISLDDAQKYTLDPSNISPDGFKINYGSSYNGGLFFSLFSYRSNDYNSRVIEGHGLHKKLNLIIDPPYSYNLTVLGWVTNK